MAHVTKSVFTNMLDSLEKSCKERGISVTRVSIKDMTCHEGIGASNSKEELFPCKTCGIDLNVDLNAAISIHSGGS